MGDRDEFVPKKEFTFALIPQLQVRGNRVLVGWQDVQSMNLGRDGDLNHFLVTQKTIVSRRAILGLGNPKAGR
jgi:hypothetical protein